MGMEFTNLTDEELCDLMCGGIEDDGEEFVEECDKVDKRGEADTTCGSRFSE